MTARYSMLIQWSDEDQIYIVSLPEFGQFCTTHGSTYEEAVAQGHELIEPSVGHNRVIIKQHDVFATGLL